MAFFEILLALFAIGVGFLIIDASLIIIGPRSWRYDIAGVAAHAKNRRKRRKRKECVMNGPTDRPTDRLIDRRFKGHVGYVVTCTQLKTVLKYVPIASSW